MDRENQDREKPGRMENDTEFESYLRQFQPREPKPLPYQRQRNSRPWKMWAAAAIVIVALGITFAVAYSHRSRQKTEISGIAANQQRETRTDERISLGRLNAAVHDDPEKLDELLDKESPKLLPDVQRGHGVLSALAAE